MFRSVWIPIAAVKMLVLVTDARAGVVEYRDFGEWQSDTGDVTAIDFTEYPAGTVITEQYAHLGAHFVESFHVIREQTLYSDGHGLAGLPLEAHMVFDEPITAFGTDFPGQIVYDLYRDGDLVYTSSEFWDWPTPFAGIISEEPFDEVIAYRTVAGGTYIDNIYFGPPIPAAPAFALIPLWALAPGRRRRR